MAGSGQDYGYMKHDGPNIGRKEGDRMEVIRENVVTTAVSSTPVHDYTPVQVAAVPGL